MTRDLFGLAILGGITLFWLVCERLAKRERLSHARRAAERGRK